MSLNNFFTVGTEAPRFSCLIATCKTWPATTVQPALLSAAGARVSALSPGPLLWSSHVAERIKGPRDPISAAVQLRALLDERTFDWVIVADDDLLRAVLEVTDRNKLSRWFPFNPLDDVALGVLTSKYGFALHAPAAGIPVPESFVVDSVAAAASQAEIFGYPVVLKGRQGFSGSDVNVVADKAALLRASAQHIERYGRVLVQRHVVGINVSASILYHRGTLSGYKAYRAECCYPNDTSASTVHEFFDHPSLDAIVRAVGTLTGFHGMLGIDFVYEEKTGTLYAIEINPRPTIGFAGARANVAYFSPLVTKFFEDESGPGIAYAGADRLQSYFPNYLMYYVSRADKHDPQTTRRLKASFGEYRADEWRLAAWQLLRFARDCFRDVFHLGPVKGAARNGIRANGSTQSHLAREYTGTSS